MIIYVDIDNTICITSSANYNDVVPIKSNIKKINKLYNKGNTIIYWTARGTTTNIDWTKITKKQLKKWGCKYHELKLKKPYYDMFIDDKSFRIDEI